MLSENDAGTWAAELLKMRKKDAPYLDKIRQYWRGKQALPVMVPKTGVPVEVRRMAEMSRINVVALPIDVIGQALYVDGYRQERTEANEPVWDVWQANRMDERQTGLHRAALAYGAAYATVLPGDTAPVIRCRPPRALTVAYGDDDWPRYALERTKGLKGVVTWRLFDDEGVYTFRDDPADRKQSSDWAGVWQKTEEHGLGVCPVVRFRNTGDLDEEDEVVGEIAVLMPLQDQMDFTTFDLLVAQHYQAFRQRYVMGWTSPTEAEKAKASASRLWTFDDPDTKVGEFGQVNLGGYLDSRASTLEYLGAISQTPPHHLLGKLVNLSTEALAAAESGQRRKIGQRENSFGESWEMVFGLAATAMGVKVTDGAQVRWRDTEARALASTVDALGKMAQMLSIPPQVLWERIPGWTQQDVERAKAIATEADSVGNLTKLLDRQMGADQ